MGIARYLPVTPALPVTSARGQLPLNYTYSAVQVLMKFGDTEIMATAVDLSSGNAVSASVDFFTDRNPKYCTKL